MIGTNDPDSDPVQVPMTLIVRAPHLTAMPSSLSLSRVQGSQATTLPLTLANSGSANLNWSLSEVPGVSWLSASLSGSVLSPAASASLTLTFNVSGLPVAVYTTKLRFASTYPGQAPVEVPVTLTVVSACQPVSNPDFSLTPSNPQVGKSVAFNAWSGAGTGPITFAWNFGDGSGSGSGQSLNHTFPSVNTRQTYTVTLTASNACTQPGAEQRKTITVQPYMTYLPAVLRLP
jgi:PKD repeat protein